MKNKKSSDGQIIQRLKIVRIGKARRSPTEQRIAFYFTFSELAKSSVLDFLFLFIKKKNIKINLLDNSKNQV
jgi:hypothetical protein